MPIEPQPNAKNSRLIIFISASLSLTISWLYISATYVLSPDSLLYIFTAQTFIDHGLHAAADVYPWPLLSILIASIHQLSGLSLVLSGHMLTAGLYAGLSCTFVLLVRDLGGSTRAQLPALLVIKLKKTETVHFAKIEVLTKSNTWALVKTFSNEKSDKVLILSRQEQTNGSAQ